MISSEIPNDVVVVSDTAEGGAAGSTRRMLQLLFNRNPSLEHWYFGEQAVNKSPFARSLDNRRKRPIGERVIKNFSKTIAKQMLVKRHQRLFINAVRDRSPSLINVRNIHSCGLTHRGLLDFALNDVPIVWTLHDCWAVRDYAFKFENSKEGLTQYAVPEPNKQSALQARKAFFEQRDDVVLVCPSRWLQREAIEATEGKIRVEHIPNGIPLSVFRPTDKSLAREMLGLDQAIPWFGFASTWANSRKGIDILIDALQTIQDRKIGLLVWGGNFDVSILPPNIQVRYSGRVYDPAISALLYSASDFFVCPSRADNLPNTCLESIGCGTAVIGSSVGGIPDIVKPGISGWTFDSDKPSELKRVMQTALDHFDSGESYSDSCRNLAVEEFDVEKTAARYASLFSSMINR